MLKLLLFISFFSNLWFYFNKIEDSNTIKLKANQAYKTHYYSEAIKLYDELLTKYEPNSEAIKLNLAHAHFKAKGFAAASKLYTELTLSPNVEIRSTAFCQLGVIQHQTKRYTLAIYYFKEALRVNPNNLIAAYDFELLKRTLQKQKNPGSSTSKGKGNNTSNQNNNSNLPPKTDNTFNSEGSKETDIYFKILYEQKRLSKQHAEKILEYIQEQETQYYQKDKRHVPKNMNQPDW
ncbi:tetratricopeptide repeat protein [uncultured Cytophaga sp.]|uniref:tetratricopeptide repeat protein n=1 Tax=uncultured Cytophaga sp. TaxID=160238 RepID=UPI0026369228|nr:tetratricopeptide repeat protein [uncultured Cytophaga sp.]